MSVDIDKLANGLAELAFVKIAEEGDDEDAVEAPVSEGGGGNWNRWLKGLALAGGTAALAGGGLYLAGKYPNALQQAGKATSDWIGRQTEGAIGNKPGPDTLSDHITPTRIGATVGLGSLAARSPLGRNLFNASKVAPKSVEYNAEMEGLPAKGLRLAGRIPGNPLGVPTPGIKEQQGAITRGGKALEPRKGLLEKAWGSLWDAPPASQSSYSMARDTLGEVKPPGYGTAPAGAAEPTKPEAVGNVLDRIGASIGTLKTSPDLHPLNASDTGRYAVGANDKLIRPENLRNMSADELVNTKWTTRTINPSTGMIEVGSPDHGDVANQANVASRIRLNSPAGPDTKLQTTQQQIINSPILENQIRTVETALAPVKAQIDATRTALGNATPAELPMLRDKLNVLETQKAKYEGFINDHMSDMQRRHDLTTAIMNGPTYVRQTNAPEDQAAIRYNLSKASEGFRSLRAVPGHGLVGSGIRAGARGLGATGLSLAAQQWLPGFFRSLGFTGAPETEVVK